MSDMNRKINCIIQPQKATTLHQKLNDTLLHHKINPS